MQTELTLPWPPSVNRYWRSVKGRVLISAEGRAYRDGTESIAIDRAKPFHDARLGVSIRAYSPDLRKRDLDNMLKAPLDALTYAGMWDDDSQIDQLSIARAGIDRRNPRLEVRIWTLDQVSAESDGAGVLGMWLDAVR